MIRWITMSALAIGCLAAAGQGGVGLDEFKLVASDPVANGFFGSSLSISGDYAVIGAYGNNDGGTDSGSAYVFHRSGTTWTQQAKLTASDAVAFDNFGKSVSISGDYAVSGAYGNDDGGSNSGSAYVYTLQVPEYSGACCVTSGCTALTETQCTELGGTWLGNGGLCDDCPAPCAGDTDGNGVVDIEDLLNMMGSWGACP